MAKKIIKKNEDKSIFGLSEKDQVGIAIKAAERANNEQLTLVRRYEDFVRDRGQERVK